MTTIFKSCFAFALAVCGIFCCSCGYHMGSMMHPEIKTVAISEVKNDTKEPYVSALVRQGLAEQFQVDGSLKLVQREDADCIVYCRIKSVDVSAITYSSSDSDRTFRPDEFNITLNAEFMVIVPGKSEPLIPMRAISGSSKYNYYTDPNVDKYYGLRQAAYELSKLAVQYTTEAW